jgi:hypothetical protein
MRNLFRVLSFLCVAMLAFSSSVHAETIDLEKNGTIILTSDEDADLQGMDFALYQVAGIVETENEIYEYTPSQAFSDSSLSLNDPDMAQADLLKQVERYIQKNDIKADRTLYAKDVDLSNSDPLRFENVEPGLYYCVQLENEQAASQVSSMLISVPFESSYEVHSYLKGVTISGSVEQIPDDDSSNTDSVTNPIADPVTDPATDQNTASQDKTDTKEDTDTKEEDEIPFTGTYQYLMPYLLAAGLALLLIGGYMRISAQSYL